MNFRILLILSGLFFLPDFSFAQSLQTHIGPEGIYVICPPALPKGFSYLISRQEAGKTNWEPKATLTFEQDSSLFFSKLQQYSQISQAFTFPATSSSRKFMWDMVLNAKTTSDLRQYAGMITCLQATGNIWYDNSVKQGTTYQYELKVIGSAGSERDQRSNPIKAEKDQKRSEFRLKTFQAQPFEKKIALYYKIGSSNEVTNILVFKRIYLQSKFEQVNANIGVVRDSKSEPVFLVTDSTVDKKMTYEYFAVPVDKWGNVGFFSDTVRVGNMITDETPIFKSIKTTSLEKESAIKLAWKFDKTPFIRSISIYRSLEYNGENYKLLGSVSGKDSVFIDKDVAPVVTYYYSLVINGAYGTSAPSARISGMLKANKLTAPPQALKANLKGKVVQLEWQRTDPYTYGYYIFRKEGNGKFNQVGSLLVSKKESNTFNDTISGLSSSLISYSLKSLNTSYQVSKLSDSVQVANPLAVSVAAIRNVKASYRDKKAILYWDISEVDNEAEGYNVYRTENKGTGKQLNKELILSTENYFEDSTVKPGNTYAYQIEVKGINNSTSAKSSEARLYIPSPAILSPGAVAVHTQKSSNIITWNITEQENIKGYTVYRVTDKQKPEKLGFSKQSQPYYIDKTATSTKSYHYAVVCQSADGTESEIEEWVAVSK